MGSTRAEYHRRPMTGLALLRVLVQTPAAAAQRAPAQEVREAAGAAACCTRVAAALRSAPPPDSEDDRQSRSARMRWRRAATTSGLAARSGLGAIRGDLPTAAPPSTIARSMLASVIASCQA